MVPFEQLDELYDLYFFIPREKKPYSMPPLHAKMEGQCNAQSRTVFLFPFLVDF